MASPAPNEGAPIIQSDTYERNPVNDCQLGKDFEVNVAIYSVLTLLQNEQRAIAIEYKHAPAKFDDVILRVKNGAKYEYYYRQVKHKDTEKNPDPSYLTWNDLLRTKKNPKDTNPPFGIPWYYEMGFAPGQHDLNDIKELGFVTNYNLVNKQGLDEESNLEELAQKLLYPTSREPKHITESDLKKFFAEWKDPSVWRPPSNDQKSYTFKEEAIEAITKGTQAGLTAANKSLDLISYGAFLRKLVFHVSMPHVNDLKLINQNLLKVFLPFHKNVLTDKYVKITDKFSSLFAITTVTSTNSAGQKSTTTLAKWATFECRRLLFEDMANEWAENHWTDAVGNFGLASDETKQPWDTIVTGMLDTKKEWNSTMKVINIFNAYSDPAMVTLKVLNTIEKRSEKGKILIKKVTDKKSFLDTIEYFEQLDNEVRDYCQLTSETFCCTIEILPAYEFSEYKNNVQSLISMQNLRKWIRFVIITQQPIIVDSKQNTDFDRIADTLLNWHDLSEDYKTVLFEKTLHLNDKKETSLRALGFEKDSIDELLNPRALSELIVHDKDKPLNLGMPKKDMDLDTDYIEREIQLPPSGCTINETWLLKDNANFGTGSINKKLLVIVDLPGKGKSSLMTSLSNKFIDKWSINHSSSLLLRINLHEIKQWGTTQSGIQFLLNHSKISQRHIKSEHASLTEAIVQLKCTSGPPSVFVLLDGYDEISDEQREMTLTTVDGLLKAKGIKRIILTSRPEANLESELEKKFGQLSLHLTNFDRDTQIRYLIKRWTSKAVKNGCVIESNEKITQFVRALIHFAGPALEHENKTFLHIPLQCWIFSECFFQQLLDYLNTSGSELKFDEQSFQILNLYNRFYEEKAEVLFGEKAHMPTSGNEALAYLKSELKESILKSMMRISIIHMMEIEDAQVIGRFCWDAYRRGNRSKRDGSKYARDIKRAMKLGVIQGQQGDGGSLSDTKPQEIRFLHRTFAEYFLARYLFENFIQEKSKLLDGTFMTKETVTDKTFELISERILKYAEFAGVRRFLDRMLTKHIPPIGEQCPFAKEDRSDALKQWPVIGHKTFNEHLANSIILKSVTDYSKLSISKNSSASELAEEDYKRLRNQIEKKIGPASIMRKGCEREPCITLMLIHCIKEYASREDTQNVEREILAHSVTLSALTRVLSDNTSSKEFDNITSCLLHWLDRTVESPNKSSAVNTVFSKWYFVFFNFLGREAEENHKRSGLIVPACELLEYHKTAPDFDKTIQAIATSRLFAMTGKRQNNKIYGEKFFELNQVSSYAIEFWFKPREIRISDKLFEGILVTLSDRNVLSRPLLNALAVSLENKITQHIKQADCPKFYDFRAALKKSKDERDVAKSFKVLTDSHKQLMLENALRPYAFIETIKLFMKNAKKLKKPPAEGVTADELSNASLKYITFFQPLMFRMNQATDLYLMRCNDWESLYYKFESVSIILWYFLVADVIITQLPDAEAFQVTQKIFFSEIGHKSLMAYAHATCCCQCKNLNYTGFGIHFPRDDKYESNSIDEPFRRLFADKLELLWKEKGEIQFIDFLLKTENFVGKDEPKSREVTAHFLGSVWNFGSSQAQPAQTKKNFVEKVGGHLQTIQRMVMTSNRVEQSPSVWNILIGGNQKTRQTKEIWLDRAEINLRTIQMAKIPCFLFSDVVAEYIPGKLSQAGLNHLAKSLKMLPLFRCEGICFEARGNVSLDISDGKLSLFDCIMDDDASSPRMVGCKERSAQIKALQEKLQGATTAQ